MEPHAFRVWCLPWKWSGLLRWNALNFSHFPEFHVANYFRTHNVLWGRIVAFHERLKNVNKSGVDNLMFCQQCRICMATHVAQTCAGDFWTPVFSVRITFGQKNTSYGSSREPGEVLWWLQPRLEILPDILFTNQAQNTQYVIGNSNSHAGAHVNTHQVSQYYLQQQVQLRPTWGI
jgi:hypothetical protein